MFFLWIQSHKDTFFYRLGIRWHVFEEKTSVRNRFPSTRVRRVPQSGHTTLDMQSTYKARPCAIHQVLRTPIFRLMRMGLMMKAEAGLMEAIGTLKIMWNPDEDLVLKLEKGQTKTRQLPTCQKFQEKQHQVLDTCIIFDWFWTASPKVELRKLGHMPGGLNVNVGVLSQEKTDAIGRFVCFLFDDESGSQLVFNGRVWWKSLWKVWNQTRVGTVGWSWFYFSFSTQKTTLYCMTSLKYQDRLSWGLCLLLSLGDVGLFLMISRHKLQPSSKVFPVIQPLLQRRLLRKSLAGGQGHSID